MVLARQASGGAVLGPSSLLVNYGVDAASTSSLSMLLQLIHVTIAVYTSSTKLTHACQD